GLDLPALGVDALELGHGLLEVAGHDLAAAHRRDLTEALLRQEVDGHDAETGGEDAVEGARAAAALDVAEHGGAHVARGALGELVRVAGARAAQARLLGRIGGPQLGVLAAPRYRALGDHGHREGDAALVPAIEAGDDAIDVVLDLGDEDDL